MAIEPKKFFDVPGSAIRFRNFQGKAGRFNNEGERYFCLVLDDASADKMKAEGWNIRYLQPRSEEDDPVPYVQVKVEMSKGRPPKIVQVTRKGKTYLDETSVQNLDWAEIEKADVCIRAFEWSLPSGAHGVKAYLKTMYVTIAEDEFEERYYDVPDSAQNIVDEAPWEDD